MKREMLKQELEKELSKALKSPIEKRIENTLSREKGLIRLIGQYRTTRLPKSALADGGQGRSRVILSILLLGLWDDMVKLAGLRSVRSKLRFMDDEKFPEVYFAYTLLIANEPDPSVYEADNYERHVKQTNPQELIAQALSQGLSLRQALYESAREMIKGKYERQHVYELFN